jgi:hypothetical protein
MSSMVSVLSFDSISTTVTLTKPNKATPEEFLGIFSLSCNFDSALGALRTVYYRSASVDIATRFVSPFFSVNFVSQAVP